MLRSLKLLAFMRKGPQKGENLWRKGAFFRSTIDIISFKNIKNFFFHAQAEGTVEERSPRERNESTHFTFYVHRFFSGLLMQLAFAKAEGNFTWFLERAKCAGFEVCWPFDSWFELIFLEMGFANWQRFHVSFRSFSDFIDWFLSRFDKFEFYNVHKL